MTYPPLIIRLLLAALVLTAAIFDIRRRRIPNWLTLSGWLLGLGFNAFLYDPLPGLLFALKGTGLALLIYFPLFLVRGMGAGDVKLMAAVGAMVGWIDWLGVFILTAVLGAALAVLLLLLRGRMTLALVNVGYILGELVHLRAPYGKRPDLDVASERAVTLPHGAVIALGSLAFIALGAVYAPK